MKRMKSALALCLLLVNLLTLMPVPAQAANKVDAITQSSLDSDQKYRESGCPNGPCVYYSLHMMVKRRLAIDGVGISGTSLAKFRDAATVDGVSVKDTRFTYTAGEDTAKETTYAIARTTLYKPNYAYGLRPILRNGDSIAEEDLANASEVKEMLIRQLSLHPEGVVVWRGNAGESYMHAVLVTSYNPSDGLFRCIDPNDGALTELGDALGSGASGSAAKRQNYVLQRINSIYLIYESDLPAEKTFTVKYNANGGTGAMADEIFTYGEDAPLSPCVFTREGYRFKGWWAIRTFDNRWRCKTDSSGWAVYKGSSVKQKGSAMVWANQAMFDLFDITEPHLYEDEASVKNLGLIDGGSITFKAQWEKIEEGEKPEPEEPDLLPPELQNVTITPEASDVVDAMGAYVRPEAPLTVEVRVGEHSDRLCVLLGMKNAATDKSVEFESGWVDRRSDGTYTFNVTAPVDSGLWQLSYALLGDSADNTSRLDMPEELPCVPWFVVGTEPAVLSLWSEVYANDAVTLKFTFSYSMTTLTQELLDFSTSPPSPRTSSAVYTVAWYTADRQLICVEPVETLDWSDSLMECVLQVPDGAVCWQLFAIGSDTQPLCASLIGTVPV